jgi:hypothetical protein
MIKKNFSSKFYHSLFFKDMAFIGEQNDQLAVVDLSGTFKIFRFSEETDDSNFSIK